MLTQENPVIHRYAWTLEEKIIISFFTFIVPVITGIILANGGSLNLPLAITGLILTWTIAFFLVRLGRKRKNQSQLQAYMDDSILFVTGFKLGESNAIDIETVKSVSTKMHGQSNSFVFKTGGVNGRSIVIPSRIAVKPGLREVVLLMLSNVKEPSKEALALAEEQGIVP